MSPERRTNAALPVPPRCHYLDDRRLVITQPPGHRSPLPGVRLSYTLHKTLVPAPSSVCRVVGLLGPAARAAFHCFP